MPHWSPTILRLHRYAFNDTSAQMEHRYCLPWSKAPARHAPSAAPCSRAQSVNGGVCCSAFEESGRRCKSQRDSCAAASKCAACRCRVRRVCGGMSHRQYGRCQRGSVGQSARRGRRQPCRLLVEVFARVWNVHVICGGVCSVGAGSSRRQAI